MNILEVIDDLKYLKLIVLFNELTSKEMNDINKFKQKIEICSFDDLMVLILLFKTNIYIC